MRCDDVEAGRPEFLIGDRYRGVRGDRNPAAIATGRFLGKPHLPFGRRGMHLGYAYGVAATNHRGKIMRFVYAFHYNRKVRLAEVQCDDEFAKSGRCHCLCLLAARSGECGLITVINDTAGSMGGGTHLLPLVRHVYVPVTFYLGSICGTLWIRLDLAASAFQLTASVTTGSYHGC